MKEPNTVLGYHYIWDVSNCDSDKISYLSSVKALMNDLVSTFKLSVLNASYNQFAPHGVTGVLLLEESHLSIHTWPENGYMAMDLFSCKQIPNINEIAKVLKKHVGSEIQIDTKNVSRSARILSQVK